MRNTASSEMVEGKESNPLSEVKASRPSCVLPSAEMQKFLLELIAQANFPGSMAEFVSGVKAILAQAKINGL